jgi:hypothetical protein
MVLPRIRKIVLAQNRIIALTICFRLKYTKGIPMKSIIAVKRYIAPYAGTERIL